MVCLSYRSWKFLGLNAFLDPEVAFDCHMEHYHVRLCRPTAITRTRNVFTMMTLTEMNGFCSPFPNICLVFAFCTLRSRYDDFLPAPPLLESKLADDAHHPSLSSYVYVFVSDFPFLKF